MFLFIFLIVSILPNGTIQRRLAKYRIPFEYLITRNSSNVTFLNENQFTVETASFIELFCGNVNCFAAVFQGSDNKEYYQMIRNLPNDGLSDSYGLHFNNASYLYSIAFLIEEDPYTCDKEPTDLNYQVATCRNITLGNTYLDDLPSYTKPNGREYCYFISYNLKGYNKMNPRFNKISYCYDLKADITGFQTEAENTVIFNAFLGTSSENSFEKLYIGSQNADNWDQNVHPYNVTVKTCLTLNRDNELNNDSCNEDYPVLCGQYADVLSGKTKWNWKNKSYKNYDSIEAPKEPKWFTKIFFPEA